MDRQTLERAKTLKAARDQAAAGLLKMEEKRAEVKPSVYQKVRAEYEGKLAEAKEGLQSMMSALLARAQELTRALDEQRRKTDEVAEEEDEVALRHHIGELTDDDFHKRASDIKRRRDGMKAESDRSSAELLEIMTPFRDEPGFSQLSTASPVSAAPATQAPPAAVSHPAPAPAPPLVTAPPAPSRTGAMAAVGAHERQTGATSRAAAAPAAPPRDRPSGGTTRPPVAPAPPPPSREQIEEALGDPFADVGAADVADGGKPFFTNPTLIVKSKGDETSYLLDLGEVVIGRAAESDIVLDEDSVLPKHAVVRFESDHYVIQSLAGDGLLHVNDKPQKRAALADGDRVRIGKSEITFRNVRYEYDV